MMRVIRFVHSAGEGSNNSVTDHRTIRHPAVRGRTKQRMKSRRLRKIRHVLWGVRKLLGWMY